MLIYYGEAFRMQSFPLIVLVVSLVLMVCCFYNLSKKAKTHYMSKTLWSVVIVFGAVVGQCAYLALEGFRKDL